jgi:hypothetical protein
MRLAFDVMGPWRSGLLPDAANDLDDDLVIKRCRAIFVSDLHLGTPG